ncbi:regulator of chromosome condensation isoform X2 [Spodoptera frugiperda]|uniref:Regulator of chromosome condensation isoform X2 n=1 Tax=Spodoptera frugiperda TaxID=7108 RepID=A0A9R0EQQ9_SPOFR|nr:regulator of chromosome condensation isoform X2 [Spodoptera frugiperda]
MPAARGVKRAASKSSAATASTAAKNKKKRGAIQWEIPSAPKKRGRVLACGQGDVGQLGLGEDVVETSKFKYVTALGDKIVDVYAGGMHTIALDSSGKVWTFGCNDEGALGRATSGESEEGTPGAVRLPAPAVAIAAGDSHSAALLNSGDVYAWGAFRDSHGSMGLVVRGREGKSCREPVHVDIGETAVAIASGGDHLVILSASGGVYTMGCGEQGQLGRLSQRSASRDARQGFSALLVPSKVTLKAGGARIWAGYHATFVLDNNDKMLAWGLNNYGQLGITGEKRKTAIFSPTECDAFTSQQCGWVRVACGQHHSLALDNNGQVYAIGRCEYGRLGLGDRAGDAEVLEPIPALQNKKVISIAAGTSNSFAVTDSGSVVSWGMGSEGQLGTGACNDAAEPTAAVTPALADRTPLHVSAGGQHTVLLVEDPTAQKEASPPPESETSEQKGDSQSAESEEEEPRPAKRPKNEQEGEISSTSSAQPSDVGEEAKPQKVNGDEKKETPMEVDETDTPQQKEEDAETETKSADEQTDTEQTEPENTQTEDSKPETTDTSSQETTDSDTKSQEPDKTDVEMSEERTEVNGTPEVAEPKTVDVIPTANPLTTTA